MEEEPPLRDREREIMMMDCFYIHETYKTKKIIMQFKHSKKAKKCLQAYKEIQEV